MSHRTNWKKDKYPIFRNTVNYNFKRLFISCSTAYLSGWSRGDGKGCGEGVKVIIQKHSSKKFKPVALCLNFNKVILVSRSLDVPYVD